MGHSIIARRPHSVVPYLFSAQSTAEKRLRNRALEGNVRAVCQLLEDGAHVDGCNERGRTALHNAAELGHLPVVQELAAYNADLWMKDADGRTALELATAQGHVQITRSAVWSGGPTGPSAALDTHWTSVDQRRLRTRAATGDLEGVMLLLKQGVEPTSTDEEGRSAMDLALAGRHTAICHELQRHLAVVSM